MVEITLEKILQDENTIAIALEYLEKKRDSCGTDGIYLSGLREYLSLNWKEITELLLSGKYEPGLVETHEILKSNGKKRTISEYCSIDRLLLRMIESSIKSECEPLWSQCSYAYRENKSIVDAADIAASYLLLQQLNIAAAYLTKPPSAALSSIAVALATAHSSALHMKICSA